MSGQTEDIGIRSDTGRAEAYLYVAVVWLNHKAAFSRIRQADRGLHWANMFVLFTAALLPFPTAVVSHALQGNNQGDQRVAIAFYALVSATWWHRSPGW